MMPASYLSDERQIQIPPRPALCCGSRWERRPGGLGSSLSAARLTGREGRGFLGSRYVRERRDRGALRRTIPEGSLGSIRPG